VRREFFSRAGKDDDMPTAFSGVWQAGTGDHFLWADAPWDDFKARYDDLAGKNLRLVALDTYVQGGQRLWAGAWRPGNDDCYLWVDDPWDSFKQKYDDLAGKGLRLVDLRSYDGGSGQRLWAGAWRAGNDDCYIWVDAPWDEFKAKYDDLAGKSLRLVALDTYLQDGQRLWAGAWRAGSDDCYIWVDAGWDSFKAQYDLRATQGLRLVALRSYIDQNQQFWAGAWRAGAGDYFVWADATWEFFKAQHDRLTARGLRLVALDVAVTTAAPGKTVVLHPKTLVTPIPDLQTAVDSMKLVYGAYGFEVDVRPVEQLPADPSLIDLHVGECVMGATTPDQDRLFANRNGVGPKEIVAYFVRSTIPPYNGCAAHPTSPVDEPGAVIAQNATPWTMAHEIGHVLGLAHVSDNHHLMTGNGTGNIINPPPILDPDEVAKILTSPYLQ
jgi:hypothetical protein